MKFQSTHSLRSATQIIQRGGNVPCVSIHALLAECDPYHTATPPHKSRFQSTHSLRSATSEKPLAPVAMNCFNPRTPCGVRLIQKQKTFDKVSFNPRTPCGVRLFQLSSHHDEEIVSIHALLAECDLDKQYYVGQVIDSFNPRTPCGVRLRKATFPRCREWFQSTHSLRSATVRKGGFNVPWEFQSTHSLRSATFSAGNPAP